ncbi:hypothetical protein PRZ48_006216 [Zasmidium cellare]|uniref:Uncharacterized protein n=1 Tax=Zasmidium cellare TaxID=395010 RepID=A0ABR0EMU7_ZASCE|nr:hypothetical protein PRZ48_006216 [Zasmidium cellare]
MDENYNPPLDIAEVAYNKTPFTIQDAGDPWRSPEPPEDLSDSSDDLPAVKAMTKEKLTARSKQSAHSQTLPLRSRGSSVGMSSYRSRSPLHDRLGNSSVRSRSRSPAPVRKQKIKQELPKPPLQKTKQKLQDRGRHASPQPRDLSAVLGFCLKCFHTDGDPNGKGHPFVFCPRAQLTVRQLAAALEASEVRAPVGNGSVGGESVAFCVSNDHKTKQEAFECAMSGGPGGRSAKSHGLVEAESFAADAMAFVCSPCVSCIRNGRGEEAKNSHCAINCFSPTWDAELWVKAKSKLKEIFNNACGASTAIKHIESQPPQAAQKQNHHHLQQAQQPHAQEASVQQKFLPKNTAPHIHPSRLCLQEDSLPANGAPRVHPSRLSLHQHEETAEAPACAEQPAPTWHSALLSNMLQAEMRARPKSWLEVALTVQGNLRQLLMMDIVHGHDKGTPWTIPLLELLDPRIASLLEQNGLDSS